MAYVILGLLVAFGPQTIYSLNKFFEAGISLFYAASLGALRQSLTRLLADDWVSVEDRPDGKRMKRVYSVTESGVEAFRAWMVGPIEDRRLETIALAKLYLLGTLPDRSDRVAALESIVDHQRLTLEYGLRSHALAREFFEELLAAEVGAQATTGATDAGADPAA